ncbi:MAG: hypothetical protein JWM64_2861 [Frankiales bacterium]|nr:hypothetical protein [Frankiales bacterium]
MVDDTTPQADHVEEVVEEEDHDLLTFTQVSDRLAIAIREEQERVAALEQAGDTERASASQARLALLLEARDRHSTVAITAVNEEAFYGLEPVGERQVVRGM